MGEGVCPEKAPEGLAGLQSQLWVSSSTAILKMFVFSYVSEYLAQLSQSSVNSLPSSILDIQRELSQAPTGLY